MGVGRQTSYLTARRHENPLDPEETPQNMQPWPRVLKVCTNVLLQGQQGMPSLLYQLHFSNFKLAISISFIS